MHPDLERLTQSFLLPHRALNNRLTMAAIGCRGTSTVFIKDASVIFAKARRYGAQFPDGEDSTTFIRRKFEVYSQLFWLIDRMDDMLRRQLSRSGNHGLPGRTAPLLLPDEIAFIHDRLAPDPVDRAVDTPTTP